MRPKVVVLHYTAGSEGPTSAESGVAYDKTRTDGTSCHAFVDSQGPGLQAVPFGDRSHSAFFHGNEMGVHFEICGTRQTRAQWLDDTSMATLKTLAQAVVYTCETLGIAKRRLTVTETRNAYFGDAITGICDHYDITRAFPEDGGDHNDVGPEFPWDVFMSLVLGSEGEEEVAYVARDENKQMIMINNDWTGFFRVPKDYPGGEVQYLKDRAFWGAKDTKVMDGSDYKVFATSTRICGVDLAAVAAGSTSKLNIKLSGEGVLA